MHRLLPLIFLVVFFSVIGCEKIDQAFEAVEKVKALKGDLGKTADQVKKDLTGQAEEIKKKALKELGPLPYLDNKQEKKPGDSEETEGRGKRQ